MSIADHWAGLLLFAGLVLAIAVFGLSVSGQFPAEHRKPELKGPLGRLIIAGSILVVAMAAVRAVWLAAVGLPVPAAIIGAGAAALAAPLVLQLLSDGVVDGRVGLIAMAGLVCVLAVVNDFVHT